MMTALMNGAYWLSYTVATMTSAGSRHCAGLFGDIPWARDTLSLLQLFLLPDETVISSGMVIMCEWTIS